jgi:membrane-bound lytic murein transglycosylase B
MCFKRIPVLALVAIMLCATEALAALPSDAASPSTKEEQSKTELQNRLCKQAELDCQFVASIFSDPRLVLYQPPSPSPNASPQPRERERNPYLTKRFGLLTPESLERCRLFISEHTAAFTAAYNAYGVPEEIICGHLRIETDFGIPTMLSPNPLGRRPAINQLVSFYVRKPDHKVRKSRLVRRREFAFAEITKLIMAAKQFGWDLFEIPGSPTGAIGLVQFEPSSLGVAVDGDGDGQIDLFNPDDAILSVAHYLATRGWDLNSEHQRRAIYAYYGGQYSKDPHKYYMKAVMRYAAEVREYLKDHPVERASF